MAKTPTNPRVKVSANTPKNYQETTAGTGQKSEEHFRSLIEKTVNAPGDQQAIYSRSKRK